MDQETYDKIAWIDINIPWRIKVAWENAPESPSLDDKEKEVFGISLTELEEVNRLHIDGCIALQNQLFELQDKVSQKAIEDNRYDDYLNNKEDDKLESDFWAEHAQNPCVIGCNAYIELRDKMCKWGDEQPEWKAWQTARKEFESEEDKKSFTGRKLNVPGTIVEMEDGSIEFIGTMNVIAGVCNDCVAFDRDDLLVKRYALVYPFTRRKANEDFYADE